MAVKRRFAKLSRDWHELISQPEYEIKLEEETRYGFSEEEMRKLFGEPTESGP